MQQPPDAEVHASNLREYLAVIRSRKWLIAVVALITTIIALFLSLRQTPIYEAEARFIVTSDPITLSLPNPENEAEIVESGQVATAVKEQLGLKLSTEELLGNVAAEPLSQTSDVVVVTYISTNPELARDAANSFVREYIQYKRAKAREAIQDQRRAIEEDIIAQQNKVENLRIRIQAALDRGDEVAAADLDARRTTAISQLSTLQQQITNLQQEASVNSFNQITKLANKPTSPVSPVHVNNALLGAFLGLFLGVGIAFLRERFDDRFRGRADVERSLHVPVLATVPRFTSIKGTRELAVVADPRGAASEAYRNLRTGLQFIFSQRGIKTLLITSASAGEGKTATTANLAIALAQAGRRVILVSCDLRRPQIEKHFGIEAEEGLSTYLLGEEDVLENLILEHPNLPNVSILPSGRIPSNPAELLTSPRLPLLIADLESRYDMVIFDSPPALPVADSVILASHVGAVILITNAATTKRSAAVHAKEQIERVGGNLVGCVLNAFDPSASPYYYEPYTYSQYYSAFDTDGQEEESEPQDFLSDSFETTEARSQPRSQR